jgi:glycopeptide antibiotics resistance protein
MMSFKNLFKVYSVFILLLVTLPINGTNSFLNNTYIIEIRLDYLLHAALFIPFIFVLRKAWPVKLFSALLYGILFATFGEGIQYFLPYRSFNINDLLANNLGIILGIAVAVIGEKWSAKSPVKTY